MKGKSIFLAMFSVICLAGVLFFAYGLTHQTSPEKTATMEVHGTEYQAGDIAKPFIQLLDGVKQPIINASCFVSVLYPNQTIFINNALMSQQSTFGFFYYDFICPDITGVYMVSAFCRYNTSLTWYYPTAFSYSSAQNIYGDYLFVYDNDNVFHEYESSGGKLNVTYNYSEIIPTNLSSFGLEWQGKASTGNILSFYALNYNTSKWTLLPNTATGAGVATGSPIISASNTITINATQYLQNGRASIMIYTSSTTTAFTDYLGVSVIGQISPYLDEIRGSGEVHITPTRNVSIDLSNLSINVTINQTDVFAKIQS